MRNWLICLLCLFFLNGASAFTVSNAEAAHAIAATLAYDVQDRATVAYDGPKNRSLAYDEATWHDAGDKENAPEAKCALLSQFAKSVAAEGGMTLADDMAILRQASQGKGNFGVGTASASDATRLGTSWVEEGYTVASDAKTLVSSDGLRQFRPPSLKPNSPYAPTGSQANFEWRDVPKGQWQGNGHLNITNP